MTSNLRSVPFSEMVKDIVATPEMVEKMQAKLEKETVKWVIALDGKVMNDHKDTFEVFNERKALDPKYNPNEESLFDCYLCGFFWRSQMENKVVYDASTDALVVTGNGITIVTSEKCENFTWENIKRIRKKQNKPCKVSIFLEGDKEKGENWSSWRHFACANAVPLVKILLKYKKDNMEELGLEIVNPAAGHFSSY